MPTRERVQAFVAMVEANEFVEAIREVLHRGRHHAGKPRRGPRRASMRWSPNEEAALRRVTSITTRPGSTFAIDGDRVIVHWVFDIEQARRQALHARRARLPDLARRPHRAGALLLRSGAAQAGVSCREETAMRRSLLNTARLMEDNPLLLRLKELESLERLVEKVGRIDLHAGEGQGLDALLNKLVRFKTSETA